MHCATQSQLQEKFLKKVEQKCTGTNTVPRTLRKVCRRHTRHGWSTLRLTRICMHRWTTRRPDCCAGANSYPLANHLLGWRALWQLFMQVDLDNDGLVNIREWASVVDACSGAISTDEACALFEFWTHGRYTLEN